MQLAREHSGATEEHTDIRLGVLVDDRAEHAIPVGATEVRGGPEARDRVLLRADVLHDELGEDVAIEASGKGETEPIADNETEEGRALNRRVVVTVVLMCVVAVVVFQLMALTLASVVLVLVLVFVVFVRMNMLVVLLTVLVVVLVAVAVVLEGVLVLAPVLELTSVVLVLVLVSALELRRPTGA